MLGTLTAICSVPANRLKKMKISSPAENICNKSQKPSKETKQWCKMADNRHSRRLKLLQPLLALPIPLPFARAFDLPIPNCPDVTFPALEFKVRFPNACAFPLLHSDPCPEITNTFTLGSFHSSLPFP